MTDERPSIQLVFAATLVVLLSDIPSSTPVLFLGAKAGILCLLLLVLVLPVHKATVLLLMLCMAGRDIEVATSATELSQTASVWQLYLGPIRPSWMVFGCAALQFVKLQKIHFDPCVKAAIAWLAVVPVVTAIAYGFWGRHSATGEIITDLKLPLILLPSTVLFRSLMREQPRWFYDGFTALLATAIARHGVDLIYFFSDVGPRFGDGNRVSLDSAKGLVVLLVFYSVFLVHVRKQRLLGTIIGVGGTLLLAVYATRLLYLTCLLGGLVLAPLYGVKRSCQALLLFLFLGTTGCWLLTVLSPQMAAVVSGRISVMTVSRRYDVSVERNILSALDPSRYAQLLNILHDTSDRFAVLWGSGYGSYYTDRAVAFPDDLGDAFPEEWHRRGEFYRAHNYALHLFYKYGFCGLTLISLLWLLPGYRALRTLLRTAAQSTEESLLRLGCYAPLLAFAITSMLQIYWSGKGLMLNGFIVGAMLAFPEVRRQCCRKDSTKGVDRRRQALALEHDGSLHKRTQKSLQMEHTRA